MSAAKTTLLRLLTVPRPAACVAARQAVFTVPARKYYHSSPPWQQDVSSQQPAGPNPVVESIKASGSQAGGKPAAPTPSAPQSAQSDENRNAAFLGEADSDDGFEADVETYPDAHRHNFDDVTASGMHGQSGKSEFAHPLCCRPTIGAFALTLLSH